MTKKNPDDEVADVFGDAPDLSKKGYQEPPDSEDDEGENPEDKWPDPPRSMIADELSEENRNILNNSRKSRAMMEAEEIATSLWWKLPPNIQKRILELIVIMNQISQNHPRYRNKLIRIMVEKILSEAKKSLKG